MANEKRAARISSEGRPIISDQEALTRLRRGETIIIDDGEVSVEVIAVHGTRCDKSKGCGVPAADQPREEHEDAEDVLFVDRGNGHEKFVPVPRCETCRWWTGERGVTDPGRLAVSGECRRHLDGEAPEPFWTEPPLAEDSERKWSRIYTVRDHGCVQWEGKGSASCCGESKGCGVPAANQRPQAPWPDFAGNAIREGDTIRHPDGMEGRVIYDTTFGHFGHVGIVTPGDRWLVDYGDGQPLGRLVLQVDDKGQGVVVAKRVPPEPEHTFTPEEDEALLDDAAEALAGVLARAAIRYARRVAREHEEAKGDE